MSAVTACPRCHRPFDEIGPDGARCAACGTQYTRETLASANGHSAAPLPAASPPPRRYPRTDTGNAELFVSLYGDQLRYDHRRGRWLVWAGHWWQPDDNSAVTRLAIKAARHRYHAAVDIDDKHERGREAQFAIACENRPRIEAMLAIARALHPVTDNGDDWDSDPWTFAVVNGVIDLHTGELRDGRPEDRLSKHAPTAYGRDATSPVFDRFLGQIIPDRDVRDYIQRLAGYILTGHTHEQMMGFWHGGGANGKSTLADALMHVMGPDYARTAAPGLLLKTRNDRHPTELADLFGARLVVSVEVDEGRTLAEALMKWLTGGDRVKARFMHQDFFEFDATAKILLLANHKPVVRGRDLAIWRRIKLVPFDVTIAEADQDESLPAKLRDEASGILNWMLAGCLAWQMSRLNEPAVMRAATAEYQRDSDELAPFIEECCHLHPEGRCRAAALYAAYKHWAAAALSPDETLTAQDFGRRMATDSRFRRSHSKIGWTYQGLSLHAEPNLNPE